MLSLMPWNWTQYDWPHFRYDVSALAALEQRFLLSSGEVSALCVTSIPMTAIGCASN
nr:DUF4172 domain-containing protein [Brucella intermedia]